jgi:hypothetical protein
VPSAEDPDDPFRKQSPESRSPRVTTIRGCANSGARIEASWTKYAPWTNSGATALAIRSASLGVPTPLGPSSVMRRTPGRGRRLAYLIGGAERDTSPAQHHDRRIVFSTVRHRDAQLPRPAWRSSRPRDRSDRRRSAAGSGRYVYPQPREALPKRCSTSWRTEWFANTPDGCAPDEDSLRATALRYGHKMVTRLTRTGRISPDQQKRKPACLRGFSGLSLTDRTASSA